MLSWANTCRIVSSCSGRSQSTSNQKAGKIKRRFLRFPLAWSVTSEGDNSKSDPIDSIRRKEGSFLIPGHRISSCILAAEQKRSSAWQKTTSVSKAQGCVLSQHKRSYNIHRERREGGEGVGRILIISPFWMKSDLHVSFSLFGSVSLCMPMWSDIQQESRTRCLCVCFVFIFSSIPA